MILVTVGTHYLGFERLIKKIDEISCNLNEEIIAQIGNTKYIPKNIKYFRFIEDEKKFLDIIKKSRVVISHAGAGTILTLSRYNKQMIIVPRLKKFNEHVDNHQMELAEYLEKEKKVPVVYDIEKLSSVIDKITNIKLESNNQLGIFLKNYIMILNQ
jgi:UDP-N-acetylglucosamine transferase subunit ALG13